VRLAFKALRVFKVLLAFKELRVFRDHKVFKDLRVTLTLLKYLLILTLPLHCRIEASITTVLTPQV
tara:strand:- start:162 stop:359 length:198 start_codon:yes stop_codon:yes gene_type:complete